MHLYSHVSGKDYIKTTQVLLEICLGENSVSCLLVDMASECECIFNDPFESTRFLLILHYLRLSSENNLDRRKIALHL